MTSFISYWTVYWIVLAILAILAIYFLLRNHKVYKYRMDLLGRISAKAKEDIDNQRYDFQWRFDELNKISYEKMLYTIWVPVNKFYDENKILGVKDGR